MCCHASEIFTTFHNYFAADPARFVKRMYTNDLVIMLIYRFLTALCVMKNVYSKAAHSFGVCSIK